MRALMLVGMSGLMACSESDLRARTDVPKVPAASSEEAERVVDVFVQTEARGTTVDIFVSSVSRS